jgi:ribonuclease P protein component
MLQRIHRFHGHGSLQTAYTHGKSVRGQSFSLKCLPRKNGNFRAAVVVSTKVSKKAPVRNRIRRRLYELIRLHIDTTHPTDFVLTVYTEDVATLPAAELKAQFLELCDRAAVQRNKNSPSE